MIIQDSGCTRQNHLQQFQKDLKIPEDRHPPSHASMLSWHAAVLLRGTQEFFVDLINYILCF